ncbi:MAG: hypothetical protein P8X68_16510 [Desulfobacterales bacterium]
MDFIHPGKQHVGLKSSSDIMKNDATCGFAAIGNLCFFTDLSKLLF